jgi:hypothetical protein
LVANESVVTDCAEEDNVVLSFSLIPPLAGDFDGDGRIAQRDLDLVLAFWGHDSVMLPDFTGFRPTGIIDQDELDAVLLNWGAGTSVGSTAIPEPSSAHLTFAVVSLLLFVSRVTPCGTRTTQAFACGSYVHSNRLS